MKYMAKKVKVLSFLVAIVLCCANVAPVVQVAQAAQIYDISEDVIDKTFDLSPNRFKYYEFYPYVSGDDGSIMFRLYNNDDAELDIWFCDETTQKVIEVQTVTDYRTLFSWYDLNPNHIYSISITNRSSYSAEVRVKIF